MAGRRARAAALREFLAGEAAGGIVLVVVAVAALIVANSPAATSYFGTLATELGPLSLSHWINDGLMALFFLLVGLEIKREMLAGELTTWRRRALPGLAALGGMAAPGLICAAFTAGAGPALRGWAIPSATDIAFAVAAISVLGSRVPPSLKVFLAALAIIDDLGAVVIIALFYGGTLSLIDLGAVAALLAVLFALNRRGVRSLWIYWALGLPLWIFVYRSGLHATLAGVALAAAVPLRTGPARVASDDSPLLRMQQSLVLVVPFVIVPLFGFANAGVSFEGVTAATLVQPVTLGVGLGLILGKPIGIMLVSIAAVRLGWAESPAGASPWQLAGTAQLCGIGFTMSLFIGLLAYPLDPVLQAEAKFGILGGSLIAAIAGMITLVAAGRRREVVQAPKQ